MFILNLVFSYVLGSGIGKATAQRPLDLLSLWVVNLTTQIQWVFFTARPRSDLTCCRSWTNPML